MVKKLSDQGNWVSKKTNTIDWIRSKWFVSLSGNSWRNLKNNNNILQEEIIKIRKDKVKHQKKMSEVFGLSRKIFYREGNELKPTRIKKDGTELLKLLAFFKMPLYESRFRCNSSNNS